MEFYRRMSDGELLAFWEQAKANVDSGFDPVGGMADELRKMEEIMNERGLAGNGIRASSERLKYFVEEISKQK